MSGTKTTELVRRAEAFASYHDEHERYGGASRDFHAMAATFIRTVAQQAERSQCLLEACRAARHEFREFFPTVCAETLTMVEAAIARAEVGEPELCQTCATYSAYGDCEHSGEPGGPVTECADYRRAEGSGP